MSSTSIPVTLHTVLHQYLYLIPLIIPTIYIVYQRRFSPLAQFPGPFLASLTKLWLVYKIRQGQYHRLIQTLHAQYGPVVRIGPDELSIADPEAVKQIYSGGSRFQKSYWYSVIQGKRKFDLFAGRDEKIHGHHRKMVARAFALDTLRDLEPYVDKCIGVLMEKIDGMAGSSIDMGKWVQLFAFDVIGEITWSTSFSYLLNGTSSGTFATIRSIASCGAWLGHIPLLYTLHEFLKPLIGTHLAIAARHGSLRAFALRETQARAHNPDARPDMVSRMLATHAQRPDEFSYDDVVSQATSNINAGSDTTAVALRAVLFQLLTHGAAMERLVCEIDAARADGRLEDPPSYDQAARLEYLQAVLYEGLRVCPSVGLNLPRVVPEGGMRVRGKYVPAGYVVGANAWAVHLDEGVYGEDAGEFRPERWIEGKNEGVKGEMMRNFLTFGGGSRACLGRNIAWMEMSKLIPALLMRYDIELVDPSLWRETCLLFVHQTGLHVRMKPRKNLEAA